MKRLKQEKDIYDVYVKCKDISKNKIVAFDFNFNIVKYRKGLEDDLPKKTLVFDGYFIHFERIFKAGEEVLLIKCAFGSFDRPEHKYILVDATSARYFVSPPVKTAVNHQAHQKIMELLNV